MYECNNVYNKPPPQNMLQRESAVESSPRLAVLFLQGQMFLLLLLLMVVVGNKYF
jgi:hypothetical protein